MRSKSHRLESTPLHETIAARSPLFRDNRASRAPVAAGMSRSASVRPMRGRATLSGSQGDFDRLRRREYMPVPRAQLEEPGYARKPSSSGHYVLPTSRVLGPRASKQLTLVFVRIS